MVGLFSTLCRKLKQCYFLLFLWFVYCRTAVLNLTQLYWSVRHDGCFLLCDILVIMLLIVEYSLRIALLFYLRYIPYLIDPCDCAVFSCFVPNKYISISVLTSSSHCNMLRVLYIFVSLVEQSCEVFHCFVV